MTQIAVLLASLGVVSLLDGRVLVGGLLVGLALLAYTLWAFFWMKHHNASDMLARTVIAPLELPVGVITALIGGPFFLWLLVRKR